MKENVKIAEIIIQSTIPSKRKKKYGPSKLIPKWNLDAVANDVHVYYEHNYEPNVPPINALVEEIPVVVNHVDPLVVKPADYIQVQEAIQAEEGHVGYAQVKIPTAEQIKANPFYNYNQKIKENIEFLKKLANF